MIGWLFFLTLLILLLGFINDMGASFGQAFGYGGSSTNWQILFLAVLFLWLAVLMMIVRGR